MHKFLSSILVVCAATACGEAPPEEKRPETMEEAMALLAKHDVSISEVGAITKACFRILENEYANTSPTDAEKSITLAQCRHELGDPMAKWDLADLGVEPAGLLGAGRNN